MDFAVSCRENAFGIAIVLRAETMTTTLNIVTGVISTVALSRVLTAKDLQAGIHELRTVGDAARFMHTNFSWRRKETVAWHHAAMCLEEAAINCDAEHAATATIALEVLLSEDGLLIEEIDAPPLFSGA
jgi:hypothetical protein